MLVLGSSSLHKGDYEHLCNLICPAQPRGASCLLPPQLDWPLSFLTLPPGLPLFPELLSMKDNYLFLKEVKNLVEKTNCELKVCFQYVNRGDRWIQVRHCGLGGMWPMAQARRVG